MEDNIQPPIALQLPIRGTGEPVRSITVPNEICVTLHAWDVCASSLLQVAVLSLDTGGKDQRI
jgi:hypothetical protein